MNNKTVTKDLKKLTKYLRPKKINNLLGGPQTGPTSRRLEALTINNDFILILDYRPHRAVFVENRLQSHDLEERPVQYPNLDTIEHVRTIFANTLLLLCPSKSLYMVEQGLLRD